MNPPSDEAEALAGGIAHEAEKLAQLVGALRLLGWGFMPSERREQLHKRFNKLRPSLVECRQLLETVVLETESAQAAIVGGRYPGLGAALIESDRPYSDYVVLANAAYQRRMTPALFAELARESERQQVIAGDVARQLLAEQPELRELAATQNEAVARSLEILALQLPDRAAIMDWLNTASPDLGEQTPLQFMRDGHADAVETLLANALAGVPS